MAPAAKKKKSKARKKTTPRKAGAKKSAKRAVKKAVRKKPSARKTAKKKIKKKSKKKSSPSKRATTAGIPLKKKVPEIEPGPPTIEVPSVEEPAQHEQAIGVVTHYYSHLGVAVVQLNTGMLRTGDTIKVKGHSTDFTQTVESIEYEHRHVDEAVAGQCVGLKTVDHAREHDIVYLE